MDEELAKISPFHYFYLWKICNAPIENQTKCLTMKDVRLICARTHGACEQMQMICNCKRRKGRCDDKEFLHMCTNADMETADVEPTPLDVM